MCSEHRPIFTDEFDLLYVHGRHGWSNLHVVTRDRQIAVDISHSFSDPVEELAGLCGGLLRGEPRCVARLYGEPGATEVIASINAEQRHVAHIEFWDCPRCDFGKRQTFDDIPLSEKTISLSVDVTIRQFVGLVYRQFEKVRWLSENRSYLKNRDPFPDAAFETLQRLWMESRWRSSASAISVRAGKIQPDRR